MTPYLVDSLDFSNYQTFQPACPNISVNTENVWQNDPSSLTDPRIILGVRTKVAPPNQYDSYIAFFSTTDGVNFNVEDFSNAPSFTTASTGIICITTRRKQEPTVSFLVGVTVGAFAFDLQGLGVFDLATKKYVSFTPVSVPPIKLISQKFQPFKLFKFSDGSYGLIYVFLGSPSASPPSPTVSMYYVPISASGVVGTSVLIDETDPAITYPAGFMTLLAAETDDTPGNVDFLYTIGLQGTGTSGETYAIYSNNIRGGTTLGIKQTLAAIDAPSSSLDGQLRGPTRGVYSAALNTIFLGTNQIISGAPFTSGSWPDDQSVIDMTNISTTPTPVFDGITDITQTDPRAWVWPWLFSDKNTKNLYYTIYKASNPPNPLVNDPTDEIAIFCKCIGDPPGPTNWNGGNGQGITVWNYIDNPPAGYPGSTTTTFFNQDFGTLTASSILNNNSIGYTLGFFFDSMSVEINSELFYMEGPNPAPCNCSDALNLSFGLQFGSNSNSDNQGPLPSSPGIQCGGGGECTSIDGPTPTFSGNFGSASVFCYDLGQKYWYRFANDPGNFFVEEDGTLLAGYSDGYLRKLDSGDDYDGITPISIGIITPFFDGGTPAQRKDTYTLKFFVDTGGEPLNVEVVYEGFGPLGFEDNPVGNIISLGSMVSNGITEFCFTNLKGTAMNLNKRFQVRICGSTHRFRLAYWSLDYDERPIPLSYKRTDPTNYGETGRKRITEIPFVVDTYGNDIQAIALLDGVEFPAQTINTNEKLNAAYYFTQEQYAREIGLLLISPCGLFEYYELTKPQFIDVIPDLVKYYYMPEDNFGEPARKRLRTIPLVINTFGTNITYTPIIDQVQLPPLTINTARKQTVLYYLVAGATVDDIIGTDFAGILDGGGTNFFEFYGYGKFDLIDTLPLRTEHFFVPEDNLGIPSRKRVRTIPFIINTFGNPISVTPVVDGVVGTTRTFITSSKRTQYYFFDTDSFGVDYALVIYGTSPFEFYGIVRPTDVEELPVPKVYDQLGPYQYDRVASLYRARVRILTTTAQLNWNLINNDNSILTGTVTTIPNIDRVYDIRFPRMIQLNVARFELSATAMFHRWSVEFLANQTGMESDNKWITIS